MIIFLHGPDTFRSKRKLSEIISKFKKQVDPSGLNITKLSGEKLESSELQEALSASGFMAPKRLIVVEDLIGKHRGKKVHTEILEMLKNLSEDKVLVFWEGDISSKKTNALAKVLKKEKLAQEFSLLSGPALTKYITDEVANKGGKIAPQAASLLSANIGNDLWKANGEINKLIHFAGDQTINVEHVQELTNSKLDDNIFKLTDALANQNTKEALKLISHQLEVGTSPIELVSKISWQFKTLLLVKSFTESNGEGYAPARIASSLKLHPFVVQKTLQATKKHDLNALKKHYQNLITIDRKLKTSQASPEALLDLFLIRSGS